MDDVARTLQAIYNSEINFSMTTMWDGGITVKLGDEMNGFGPSEGTFDTIVEAVNYLRERVFTEYPDSKFTKENK